MGRLTVVIHLVVTTCEGGGHVIPGFPAAPGSLQGSNLLSNTSSPPTWGGPDIPEIVGED